MSYFVKCPESFLGLVPAGPLVSWLALRSLCHDKARLSCEASVARIAEVADVPTRTVRTHLDWLTVAGLVASEPIEKGRVRSWTLCTDIDHEGLEQARGIGLRGGPRLRAAAEKRLQACNGRAATVAKPTENGPESGCTRVETNRQAVAAVSKPTDSSPQGAETRQVSGALDNQTTDNQTNQTDRQDASSSSSSSPSSPDGSSSSPGSTWLDGWSDDDLMAVDCPSDDFGQTWKLMTADERRAYLIDGPPPPWWPDKKPAKVETIQGINVTVEPDGRITCGRYPALSGAAFQAALEAAGGPGGPDRHHDLVQALDEVGSEVTVTAPDGHVRMVARWVKQGERPRGASREQHRPSKVQARYRELEQQRALPSGRRDL
jgi:hypothetical protein